MNAADWMFDYFIPAGLLLCAVALLAMAFGDLG